MTNSISNNIAAQKPKQRLLSKLFMLAVFLGGGYLAGMLGAKNYNIAHSTQINSQANRQVVLNESQLISDIAKTVGSSVVSVNVTGQSTSQDIFGFGQSLQSEGAGTGFILNTDGIVVTNRHVVPAGTSNVSVTLSDGTELSDVEVIGRTGESDTLDVAFLKIKDKKGKTLTPIKLGDSSKMQVGDKVVAIGNALGRFQNTVTSGILSGYGRSVQAGDQSGGGATESLQNLFQTDAAINPGNSGGPLVNINGEVIGINTAVAGNSQGIGFAIPIGDVQGVIKSVLTTGKLQRPYLGVRYVLLSDDYAYQYNLTTKRGAYIAPQTGRSAVVAGSPAEKAGLKEKDIITKVDGIAVDEKNSLISLLGRKAVGDEVSLTVIRDGQEQTKKVTLEAVPGS